MVDTVIERFKRVDPLRATRVKLITNPMLDDVEISEGNYDNNLTKTIFYTRGALKDIPDSLEVPIPEGCEVKQLIIQQIDPLPGDKKYTIHQPTWARMDKTQKALTVLHEAFYITTILDGGATDSLMARYLNGFFAMKAAEKIGMQEYFQLLSVLMKKGVNWDYTIDFSHIIGSSFSHSKIFNLNYANAGLKNGKLIVPIGESIDGFYFPLKLYLYDSVGEPQVLLNQSIEYTLSNEGKIQTQLSGGLITIMTENEINGVRFKYTNDSKSYAIAARVDFATGVIREICSREIPWISRDIAWIMAGGVTNHNAVGASFSPTGQFEKFLEKCD